MIFTQHLRKRGVQARYYCTLSSGLRSSSISTRSGINLHVVRSLRNSQSNQLPILCIPGALGTAVTDFLPQLEGLQNCSEIIAFDPRGYGQSRPPERDFPLDYFGRDGADGDDIMRALDYDSYNLIGWSDGAIASMFLASRERARVNRLILVAGNSFFTHEELLFYEKVRYVASSWSPQMRGSLEQIYGVEGLQTIWTRWCDAMQQLWKEKKGNLCTKLLKDIRCPTLIVQGAKDTMTAPSHAEFLAERIPGAKVRIFPEGKHNVHIRYASEFNKIADEFFA